MTPRDLQQRSQAGSRSSLSVREVRAGMVYDELRANPELFEIADDIAGLPRLSNWSPPILEAAIDDLVADGRITEAADGRLVVRHQGHGA